MNPASLMQKLKYLIDILDGRKGLQLVAPGASDPGQVSLEAERAFLSTLQYDIDECDGRYHDLSHDLALIMAQIAAARRQPLNTSGVDRQ